jgi:hypothetical protein
MEQAMLSRDSMLGAIGALSFSALLFDGASAVGAEDPVLEPERPHASGAIVDGLRVQPRPDDLKRLNRRDVTPAEAKEIDEIYRDLMKSARQHGSSQIRLGDTPP